MFEALVLRNVQIAKCLNQFFDNLLVLTFQTCYNLSVEQNNAKQHIEMKGSIGLACPLPFIILQLCEFNLLQLGVSLGTLVQTLHIRKHLLQGNTPLASLCV